MTKLNLRSITKKLGLTILWVTTLLVLLFYSVLKTLNEDKNITKKVTTSKKQFAIRGNIYTSDNFTVGKSVFLYKAIIDTRYLDPTKKDLFISLFSIYSGIKKEKIYKRFEEQKRLGKLVLSYNISSHQASKLQELSKLVNYFEHDVLDTTHKVSVFKPSKKTDSFYSGLDIVESGEKRLYPYEDSLTPLIGYVRKYEKDNSITRIKGIKGIEKTYDSVLNNYKNGLLSGDRDVQGNIILSKYSTIKQKQDGQSLKLNISLKLQRNVELILDRYKEKFQAKEIIASVMDSTTGKVYTLATSNRFNPQSISQDKISYLNVNAAEYQFEPGSIIKPITMALVFDKGKVQENELLNAYNKGKRNKKGYYPKGRYKIGKHTIGDDHRFKKRYITPTDTIIHSSNIGILQLAQRLNSREFLNGFQKFSLGKKTGIDIYNEKKGLLHSLGQYRAYEDKGKDNIYKATDSYGQGILSTFIQVLKAYSVFNNNGKIVTPQIVSQKIQEPIQVIKPQTAKIIKDMLIKTVKKGTGKATDIEGIEIGGKTGTSQIARKGKYQREYISSFFGFANMENKKYTIGVTVFEPSYKYHYASQSATVIFKDIVNLLK